MKNIFVYIPLVLLTWQHITYDRTNINHWYYSITLQLEMDISVPALLYTNIM